MRKYRETGRNEMDSQRELLDTLMGVNRNNDRVDEHITDFRDERVCKFFLTGMCPYDIFVNTKMDEGPCPKVHSEDLKAKFAKSNDVFCYDSLIERHFQSRINDAERIIKRARVRVEEDANDETINPDINPEIIRINKTLSKLVQDAEKAGEAGDVDAAAEMIMVRYDHLIQEKAAHMSKINEALKKKNNGNDKKLRVCDVCGSFLSLYDSDKRLQDHFLGKQHIGFTYMRDALEKIKARREERRLKDRERGEVTEPSGASSAASTGPSGSSNNRDSGRDSSYRGRSRSGDRRDSRYGSDRGADRDYHRGSGRGGDGYYGGGGSSNNNNNNRDNGSSYERKRDRDDNRGGDRYGPSGSSGSSRSRRSNSRENNGSSSSYYRGDRR